MILLPYHYHEIRFLAHVDQFAVDADVHLFLFVIRIVQVHDSLKMIEVTLLFECISDNHADGAGITTDTRSAVSLINGVLTVEHVAQHVRLVVLDILIQFVEIGFLHPEFPVDQEDITVGMQVYALRAGHSRSFS